MVSIFLCEPVFLRKQEREYVAETVRRQIISLLMENELTSLELSHCLRISEKEVLIHLPHIRSSVEAMGRRFVVTAAGCLECGYSFEDRRRLTKPGRCPRCRGEHITDPRYRVV